MFDKHLWLCYTPSAQTQGVRLTIFVVDKTTSNDEACTAIGVLLSIYWLNADAPYQLRSENIKHSFRR